MKPTIGRIVIYRDKGQPDREYPAIVQRVWGDGEDAAINVVAFFDNGPSLCTSVAHVSHQGASMTWDWPPRI